MKRVLAGLLILLGSVIAGCEKEIIREYPAEHGRYEPHRHREYRLSEEAVENGGIVQVDTEVQPE